MSVSPEKRFHVEPVALYLSPEESSSLVWDRVSSFEMKRVSLWPLKPSGAAVFQALPIFDQNVFLKGRRRENMGHFPSVFCGFSGFWEVLRGVCKWLFSS